MTARLLVKFKPALIHFAISLGVAALAALVVFRLWFPSPYSDFAGGTRLFLILVTVDVVMGPVLTFVVFNPAKTRRHLFMDLGAIALLQVAALAYGLHTVAEARPVVLAAENKLFRVVPANAVKADELPAAREGFRALSWRGPRLVGVRRSHDSREMMASVELALQGYDVGTRPKYWLPYAETRQQVIQQATPLAELSQPTPWHVRAVKDAAGQVARPASDVGVLPMVAKKPGWYVLVDRKTGDVLGFARLEPGGD